MVLIPGGKFLMGSPDTEKGRGDHESPQHSVKVAPFFMGKFPVTQAQWKAVANFPKVKIDLRPDPSGFEGANLPVERVSWHHAVEFCERLSRKTGRKYRLPSEAEWEYACRAGTTTPFHFGETISSELTNYRGDYFYGSGSDYRGNYFYEFDSEGIYREQTTKVGSFPANAFGLYDMHGNVWEWCEDSWHKNYNGAPTDGSAWINKGDNPQILVLLRGGSWYDQAWNCRSAYRHYFAANYRQHHCGFRVVCAAART